MTMPSFNVSVLMTVRSLEVHNYNNQGKTVIIMHFEKLKTKMKRENKKQSHLK